MNHIPDEPWKASEATCQIRQLASDRRMNLSYTVHARERLKERDLLIGDVLYVLKHGFVYEDPEVSTNPEFYKYKVEGKSPNSNNRSLRVVAIPDIRRCDMKVVTVMWVDET